MCNKPFGELGVRPQFDHIKRVESRGTNRPENIQALCPNCHDKKTAEENLKKLLRQKQKQKRKLDPGKEADKQLKEVEKEISKQLKGLI
jgi:5-methylcytosine-specific restriction endonuclease McrA